MDAPQGRLELTWSNKDKRLLASEQGGYAWVDRADYRVAEVRLLHEVCSWGESEAGNLLIRGDALHALRSLASLPEYSSEFMGKVRLAYLDPPFNTEQAFAHYDDALEHSVWLTMMRDRLEQVKRLLSPNGSVWVHCDDSEQAYLKVVMDELFGRDAFAGTIVWRSSDNSNNDALKISGDHNYLLVYGASAEWRSRRRLPDLNDLPHYRNPDNDPNGPWFDGNPVNSPNPRENLRYTIKTPTGKSIPPPPNGWRWSFETLQAKLHSGEVRFSEDESRIIRRTYYKDHAGLPPSSMWTDHQRYGHNRQSKSELRRLFPDRATSELFPTPKPERLLQQVIESATEPGDLVLDCFLGSGTTAAVAHKLGRRWVGIERSAETIEAFIEPRLRKVVCGEDRGGISREVEWLGGGGYRVLEISPSMFTVAGDRVVLSEWATNGRLQEAVAAQVGATYAPDPPFAGHRGRSRLAVVDGLVNEAVIKLLLQVLDDDEVLHICGTALDPEVLGALQQLRPGSVAQKIPESILQGYRREFGRRRRWERTRG